MSTEEPPSKKAKSADDWADHAMNIEECVMKADETKFLSEMAEGDLQVLQGIGPKADKVLEAMGLKTIKDLAGECSHFRSKLCKIFHLPTPTSPT